MIMVFEQDSEFTALDHNGCEWCEWELQQYEVSS